MQTKLYRNAQDCQQGEQEERRDYVSVWIQLFRDEGLELAEDAEYRHFSDSTASVSNVELTRVLRRLHRSEIAASGSGATGREKLNSEARTTSGAAGRAC